jgi:uncharacterized protein (TIGR00375 family)
MRITADLHIHSRYSRATSSRLNPACLERWSRIKGIDLLGAGDATHPLWLKELRENLEDAEQGLYILKKSLRAAFDSGPALAEGLPEPPPAGSGATLFPRFVLSAEISTIYKKYDKTRKVHHLILLPDFKAAAAFNLKLERVGNIVSDGRPILGIDSRDLLAMLLDADDRAVLIPAHIWTPWFSALGGRSGFDSIEECYGDLTRHIPAIETGLSSNPPMNWALGSLDGFSVISNSDAHSPDKLGREATVFDMEMSYPGLCSALRGAQAAGPGGPGSRPGILETIEFFPQEGKYHYDGHRICGIRVSPAEAAAAGGICPVCGKALTRGVMGRVLELADRPVNEEEPCPRDSAGTNRRPYRSLIPLREILSELLGCGGASKKVDAAYHSLISSGGTELSILADLNEGEIEKLKAPGLSGELLAQAIGRMRSGRVAISPGYDGEYGVIRVFSTGEPLGPDETGLFDLPAGPAGGESPAAKVQPGAVKAAARRGKRQSKGAVPGAPALQTAAPVVPVASALRQPFVPDSGQERVIACNGRRALVVAGPGAGKTAVLAAKAARLIQEGAAPSSILAVSFTVKAAAELRERITGFAGPAAEGVRVSTFHAFCASLLREEGKDLVPDFTILGEKEKEKILREICGGSRRGGTSPGSLGSYIEERKRYLLLPGETSPSLGIDKIVSCTGQIPPPVPELEALYNIYRERLKDLHLADYEDLIAGAVRLLASRKETLEALRRRFRHFFVDEYQDINFSQYVLVRLLVPSCTEDGENEGAALWVIGDPNQAIYGFRGSDKRFIDRFAEDYPGAIRLELLRSFRCAGSILKAAGRLADTRLTSAAGEGGPVSLFRREYPSDRSEAEGIARTIAALLGGASFFALDSGAAGDGESAPGDCAVLVRAAALAVPVVKALRDHGIPCEISGQSLWWEEEPAKALLDFIREREEKNTGAADADPAGAIMAAWETLAGSGGLKGRCACGVRHPMPAFRNVRTGEGALCLPCLLDKGSARAILSLFQKLYPHPR